MTAYYDLGSYSRRITTNSPEAQTWFDRGINWIYGFNHAEAIKCFGEALKHDPDCAMAHWGVSYAAGPNYNLPWHPTIRRARRRRLPRLTTRCRPRSPLPTALRRSSRR